MTDKTAELPNSIVNRRAADAWYRAINEKVDARTQSILDDSEKDTDEVVSCLCVDNEDNVLLVSEETKSGTTSLMAPTGVRRKCEKVPESAFRVLSEYTGARPGGRIETLSLSMEVKGATQVAHCLTRRLTLVPEPVGKARVVSLNEALWMMAEGKITHMPTVLMLMSLRREPPEEN